MAMRRAKKKSIMRAVGTDAADVVEAVEDVDTTDGRGATAR
jgi:hypothetical protein